MKEYLCTCGTTVHPNLDPACEIHGSNVSLITIAHGGTVSKLQGFSRKTADELRRRLLGEPTEEQIEAWQKNHPGQQLTYGFHVSDGTITQVILIHGGTLE